jgi:hypothetical protein
MQRRVCSGKRVMQGCQGGSGPRKLEDVKHDAPWQVAAINSSTNHAERAFTRPPTAPLTPLLSRRSLPCIAPTRASATEATFRR